MILQSQNAFALPSFVQLRSRCQLYELVFPFVLSKATMRRKGFVTWRQARTMHVYIAPLVATCAMRGVLIHSTVYISCLIPPCYYMAQVQKGVCILVVYCGCSRLSINFSTVHFSFTSSMLIDHLKLYASTLVSLFPVIPSSGHFLR